MVKQTAGREQLGEFAPKFAQLNDDVLFGEVWNREEIAEILTHAAFYAGWPKAWAAFKMAKEVWAEETSADSAKEAHEKSMPE